MQLFLEKERDPLKLLDFYESLVLVRAVRIELT